MKKMLALCLSLVTCVVSAKDDRALSKATRVDKAGWIYVHLEGSPGDIGYQHGYLLANEIDEAVQMFSYFLEGTTKKGWKFYRAAAERMFWPKLDKEYQAEIEGIAEGARARGKSVDRYDVTALNGWIELAQYYVPYLANKTRTDSMNNKAPGNCSAFIATGSFTADGRIVMAHNSWVEYIVGERWNVVADIVPEHGYHIMMDAFPGYIHSGDDFAMNSAGLVNTETTITQFRGFDEQGIPEFMRARKATQYASSIDEYVRIMTTGNNGGYANTWLIGDLKTNEIGKLDLGLKHYKLWRTKDGVYVGSNFATDEELIAEETTFKPNDTTTSPNVRKIRWEQLVSQNKGKVDAKLAMQFELDHIDANQGKAASNKCVICGHVDEDPNGALEWDEPPFYPMGSVNGKVTTAALAKDLKFWARMGHPCGADFIASTYFEKHPQFKWQSKFLRDMKAGEWTLFEAKK